MRKLKEILKEEGIAMDRVWYDRHQLLKSSDSWKKTPADIKKGALESARKVKEALGKKNLGPYDDFEWGMLNGRLETLRWVLGDDWGMLDT